MSLKNINKNDEDEYTLENIKDIQNQVNYQRQELVDGGFSGVETEGNNNKEYFAKEPFNPAEVSIQTKPISIDAILRRLRSKTILLTPDFQRNYIWDEKRKSLLIESMIMKIPIPMFYVAEDYDGNWEVVDGLQRLSTIRDFILGPNFDGKGFKLTELEYLEGVFSNKNFYTIQNDPKASRLVNNIMETDMYFTIIKPETPEKVKRNIFNRINTGGMKLSDQEIRHALYHGKSTVLLNELVNSSDYKKSTTESVNDDRMVGRELILRFLAFNILGRAEFKTTMDDFLSNTMILINGDMPDGFTDFEFDIDEVVKNFHKGIRRSQKIFEKHSFRKSTYLGDRRGPINKALFEVWINILSQISEQETKIIVKNLDIFTNLYADLLDDESFANSISRHGGTSAGASNRYKSIIKLLKTFFKRVNDD